MTFKKAIMIFFLFYGLIGIYIFSPIRMQHDKIASNPDTRGMQRDLIWEVDNESNGNYSTPSWLRDKELKKNVGDVEGASVESGGPEFTPAYQLMSLFATLELGDSNMASSFVNPYLTHRDYNSVKVNDIIEKAASLADYITKSKSLVKVKISSPILVKDSEVTYTAILQYKNGREIKVQNIPMINLVSEEKDQNHHGGIWYININLQELTRRIEQAEQK